MLLTLDDGKSTRPVNHTSEIKLYNKIIYYSIIYNQRFTGYKCWYKAMSYPELKIAIVLCTCYLKICT